MKKYDELYQEYPKVMKDHWEKCKAEHPMKRLRYNRHIKNDSMSDEAIAKHRKALAVCDEPLFDQFVEFLTAIIKENFDNYTGSPENTEMVLKTYTFTPKIKRKKMPSYIKESYELVCPVKKAEVQTNE